MTTSTLQTTYSDTFWRNRFQEPREEMVLRLLVTGVVFVLLLSKVMDFSFQMHIFQPEIASRPQADLTDIILAVAAGSAGVFAFTPGTYSAVVGVATFLIQDLTPRTWWEVDEAKQLSLKAVFNSSIIILTLGALLYLWKT